MASIRKPYAALESVPDQVQDYAALYYLQQNSITTAHVQLLRATSQLKDYVLAKILHLTPKTFAKYAEVETTIKKDTQEHMLLLTALYKHGSSVFESTQNFNKWLKTANLFFDNQEPITFLDTITGIRFVDDRLTALEYGDNV
jgi:uncharacterized protein (DUF2384 family)